MAAMVGGGRSTSMLMRSALTSNCNTYTPLPCNLPLLVPPLDSEHSYAQHSRHTVHWPISAPIAPTHAQTCTHSTYLSIHTACIAPSWSNRCTAIASIRQLPSGSARSTTDPDPDPDPDPLGVSALSRTWVVQWLKPTLCAVQRAKSSCRHCVWWVSWGGSAGGEGGSE